MVRHYGCKKIGCKVVRAYIRVNRTRWVPVGYYYTGCDRFDSDIAITRRQKDPVEQARVATILARLRGK